jgi:hypothetical protein
MPEVDLTVAVATEVAKQLPVRDALEAPARQTGQLLQDIVKTIQLALAPVQLLGALQDRLRAFIDRSVRAVPEERRISPAPQILGPIIEGIRYEPDGTPIDEMFSALLSTSMDGSRYSQAHPAFASMVRSLSADEAHLLKSIAEKPIEFVSTSAYDRQRNWFDAAAMDYLDPLPTQLTFRGNATVYLEHLRQMGLLDWVNTRKSEPILDADGKQVGLRQPARWQLSPWGCQFAAACLKTSP